MINEKIEAIKTAVMEELAKSEHLQDIQDIRVKFLGKKGELTAIMKEMKNFSKEDRPKIGQLVNTARNAIEEQLTAKLEEVKAKELAAKIESEKIDITCRAVNRLRVTNIPSIRPCASWKTPSCAWAFPSSKGRYRIGLLQLPVPQSAGRPPGTRHAGLDVHHRQHPPQDPYIRDAGPDPPIP